MPQSITNNLEQLKYFMLPWEFENTNTKIHNVFWNFLGNFWIHHFLQHVFNIYFEWWISYIKLNMCDVKWNMNNIWLVNTCLNWMFLLLWKYINDNYKIMHSHYYFLMSIYNHENSKGWNYCYVGNFLYVLG